ncbi:hypothetical protein FSP39_017317 [Pinctada imbricata]|uniref:HAT C-terminal dimerisation domain-containing protein n=1 Tax=Pinctada imbricata TaxID=66713 RepID=A0AA89BM76_PINIB|nr:hypothetical protein FSP39_017317 [Pinctada imbricata]
MSEMCQPIRACGGHLGFQIGSKNTNLVEGIEYLLPVKFPEILCSGCRGDVENVKSLRRTDDDDDGRTTDGRRTARYDNSSLELRSDNIDQRFEESLPLLTAFAIFDPLLVPDKSDSQFKTYGKTQVQIIAEHFFKEDVESKEEMIAEWSAFKYHLLRMKHDMKNDSGTQNSTSTQSALQRLLQLRVPEGPLFPKFAKVAAVILSLPVSNAWPERGASAIKRIKTRLRNRIKNPMLGSLMQVSINGPDVTEAKNIIDDSVKSWYEVKQRRKIRASDKQTMDSASAQPVVTLADASTQADIPDEQRQQDVEFVRNQMNRVLEVLKLPTIS